MAAEIVLHPRVSQHGPLLRVERATAGCLYAEKATAGYWALPLACEKDSKDHKPGGV